jgi:hypothetical protein
MRNLWTGICSMWIHYKKACQSKDDGEKDFIKITEDIQASEEKLQGEVTVINLYKKIVDDPCKLRLFMEDKLAHDYFFKSAAIEKASSNINIKNIHAILDRDEASMD